VVRGFISQEKGVNVNWVIATAWITKDKACKLEVRALKYEGKKLSRTIVS
jgi:hypothetical protein